MILELPHNLLRHFFINSLAGVSQQEIHELLQPDPLMPEEKNHDHGRVDYIKGAFDVAPVELVLIPAVDQHEPRVSEMFRKDLLAQLINFFLLLFLFGLFEVEKTLAHVPLDQQICKILDFYMIRARGILMFFFVRFGVFACMFVFQHFRFG